MGRKQGAKKKQAEEGGQQNSDLAQPADPPRAALAVHPAGAAVALAVGTELRVYDARTQKNISLISKPEQRQVPQEQQRLESAAVGPLVRGVAFDAAGRYLLAGSEDKAAGLRIWDCSSWELIQTIKVPKKVTNITFTPDGKHVLAADKFGDVLVASTERPAGLAEGQQQEPEILLGHFCAILTSLALSSGGRFLATTDRDQRVRVSVMPVDPLAGAHEIQSFCLGHLAFVNCSTFIKQGSQELLVSGSGDGTLRLWDPMSGALLHTLQLPPLEPSPGANGAAAQQQAQDESTGSSSDEDATEKEAAAADGVAAEEGTADAEVEADEEAEPAAACSSGHANLPSDAPVPLALAASPDGCWIVVAVDGRDELCLVRLDWTLKQLQKCSWSPLSGLYLPACLAFDGSGRLWAAGGPVADDSVAAFLACGSVVEAPAAAGMQQQQQPALASLVDAPLPDWLPASAAQQLEAKAGNEALLLAEAAQRRLLASQVLKKRKYSLHQRENRKRQRRDKVFAAAAAAQTQAAEQQG